MNVITKAPAKALSAKETRLLSKLESDIRKNLEGFKIVGKALATIKEQQLYRIDYDTFEEYCLEQWDISRPRAYQFIDSYAVVENLSTMVDKDGSPLFSSLPQNERQTRPLTSIPMEQQGEIWTMVIEDAENEDKKITASFIQRCVDLYRHKQIRTQLRKARNTGKRRELFPETVQHSFTTFMDALHNEMKEPLDNSRKKEVVRMLREILVTVESK